LPCVITIAYLKPSLKKLQLSLVICGLSFNDFTYFNNLLLNLKKLIWGIFITLLNFNKKIAYTEFPHYVQLWYLQDIAGHNPRKSRVTTVTGSPCYPRVYYLWFWLSEDNECSTKFLFRGFFSLVIHRFNGKNGK